MLDKIPSPDDMTALVGERLFAVWTSLAAAIDEKYYVERLWNKACRDWQIEYKYRRGGKTLCGLYAALNRIGLMMIFGRDERGKVEAIRHDLSKPVQIAYDDATTYHDGKWVMFEPVDDSQFSDYLRLLAIKRRPNK